ncbi:hypothetical protein CARUB_v10003988mg [Capsella rubella]|uniref:BAT2 N-terminal domain-containing protein n=1 Tax=Capsella rubella TaxID=81985 RepID=R0F2J9_9BRAS|nr:protein MODIFIER OF SNC1 1 isoform X2 [Capsella rubella]EOA15897.1 hypothetical protein CARUB_v10003988mg [Capsella rubella]
MTSSTAGDRRWGTTRRSGMTILGKVAVPKPINLPSQRLENQGLDPNVEIVPKGTLSWGSKSSLNAWGTSSLSPRTESGPGSPSHLSNRPSSGGSGTRPSTADSNKAHDSSSSVAWDSNSRPSSASGVFPSNQASVALQRPHSADTRPGSSQLSRFAEPVSETSATWGQHVPGEKLGVAPSNNDGFALSSGDFPSLGAEKECSEKSTRPQDAGPRGRPSSSSGRSVEEQNVDCTKEANERIGEANSWRRDDQPYSEDAPRHCRGEGQLDSRGSQSYPNANFPHHYDAWRGPPVNNHQGGGWYRGNHPYGGAPMGPGGAPMGPGGFHMDPFPFYPTQVPPAPGRGAGPRGNHANNEMMFRPPMLDSYVHPRMQTRPGFYVGPPPHEGYYGPPMGYGSPSNRDLPFAGRPAGPHTFNNHSGQGGYDTPGSSVALDRNEPSHSQEPQRPFKVLLKHQDGRLGEDKAKQEEFLGNRLPNAETVAQQLQTSRNERRENRNEASGEVQPAKAELAAPGDPSLIQKIEGLNAKTRTNDGWQNDSSVVSRDEQESKPRTFNSGNPVNKVSARNPRTGHANDSKNLLHYNQGDPATNKNAELAAMSGTAISRRYTQQTQGRADPPNKRTVNSEGNDGWQKTTDMSGSSLIVDESLDTDSIRRPGSGKPADPNDNQRSTMRELARQRAQQRQKEEEERARDQRAKALAKLEELNRRSQVSEEGSVKNMEAASNASLSDMQEDPGSHSPARFPSNSGDVHFRSSIEVKNTVAAANSLEPTGGPGENTMHDTRASTEYTSNVGPSQQNTLPRGRDDTALKQKRLGYKQKQNVIVEKKMAASSVATTEVFDDVPSPEVVNEGVSCHNSDMPATSSVVSTESTFTKRKNNRNGKKKHKAEETSTMNTTRVAVGKETKPGDESIEAGRERASEMDLGSVSVPCVDIKVSGDSSEQNSSFTNEESQNRAKNYWKSQHLRRTQRNSLGNKPSEKLSGNNAVVWAPIHPQQKADVSTGVGSQNTVPEFGTSTKSQHQGQTSSKSKRVEIERYVVKPIVKEMAEPIVSKNLVTAAPDMPENVNHKDNSGGEGTGILQPSGSTTGKPGSPSKSRHGNGRQGKHGREQGSWHQRGSGAPTKALEDGQSVTSNQPIRGTVNYHSSNQTEQIAAKNQTTCNDDGWNDGWYMPPEIHHSAVEEMEASAVGKDQGMGIHGKQHASRSNKDGGSNYGDPKKAMKKDSNKAHMQQSGHGFSQPDFPVASRESRGPGDNVWHTANRTGKFGGRESTRDKTYGSQKKDVAGYEHQGVTTEHKMKSADTQAQSQNRSTNKEVQVEQNPNSMFQKNTGQGRRFGRGHESQGGWGLSAQENMHHHHQRPSSNRDRQKPTVHYEYKPVGSHTNDGERNREQSKDSSQTEGPRYREKGQGQGQQRHGGYQHQRGTSGRNTGHGFTGERN